MSKIIPTLASAIRKQDKKKDKTMARVIDTTITNTTTNTKALLALTAEIRRYDVLSAERESELFSEFATATESRKAEIRKEIANANMRFVLSVAKKYSGDGDKVCELVSIGTMGIYKAVDTFDLSKGFRFISHAVHWIRAEISEYFRSEDALVRRSNNAKIGGKENAVRQRFLQTEMREPSEDEIISALESEYGIKVLDKCDVVKVTTARLDDNVSSDGDGDTLSEIGDVAMAMASVNGYERESELEDARYRAARLLKGLSFRESEIVCRKFGIGYDREYELDEIADTLGYTHERVRQILRDTLTKLRGKERVLSALVG